MIVTEHLWESRFNTILYHVITVFILFGISYYLYLRAKKTPLLFSFLSISAMTLLWMVSKILKTVSPNLSLRWFFVITQYIGVQFLGVALVAFAYLYIKNQQLSKKTLWLLSIPPLLGLLTIITNPWHMSFYSTFTYYRTRFGPAFYLVQGITYVLYITGVWIVSKNYTKQPGLKNKKGWAYVLASMTMFPLLINLYYVAFKTDLVEWILPVHVFDITPITTTMSLALFIYPSVKFRFFDISTISHWQIFQKSPQGVLFVREDQTIYDANKSFNLMFGADAMGQNLESFFASLKRRTPDDVVYLHNNHAYKIDHIPIHHGKSMFIVTDISTIDANKNLLFKQHSKLQQINDELKELAQTKRHLALTKARCLIAQDMHDILGHSLTIAIAKAELAACEENSETRKQQLEEIHFGLTQSIKDLEATSFQDTPAWCNTDLDEAILELQSMDLQIDLVLQGVAYALTTSQSETVYRCVQEAVTNSIKHGQAKTIHIILRYSEHRFDLFAIDDGVGCKVLSQNYGLKGMTNRFIALGGNVRYSSDGEKGFAIHTWFPMKEKLKSTVL